MALQEVRGGSDTSDRQSLGSSVDHRTAPIVPPRKDSPLGIAYLLQRNRANGLLNPVPETALQQPNHVEHLLPLARATDPQTVFPKRRSRNTRFKARRRKQEGKEQTTREVILATNPTLDALLEKIQQTPPNWKYLEGKLPEISKGRNSGNLRGQLAELLIKTTLETIIDSDQFRDVVKIVDIDDKKTNNYHFKRSKSGLGLYVSSNNTHMQICEYDGLVEIDSIPTIIEVKAKSSKRDGTDSFNDALRDQHIKEIFAPLQELYGPHTYFGYVVIGVPKLISNPSKLENNFRNQGGHLIAMKATLAELKEHTQRITFSTTKPA